MRYSFARLDKVTSGKRDFNAVALSPRTMKKGYIYWGHSEPQAALLSDLKEGVCPMDNTQHSDREIWENMYMGTKAFGNVCFEQFQEKLKDHREQVKLDNDSVQVATEAFANYRSLHPQKQQDKLGRTVMGFDETTKQLLLDDIRANLHKGLTPATFRATRPDVYEKYPLDRFRPKIYQTERLVRWHNYLEIRREEKKAANEERWAKHRKNQAALKRIKEAGRAQGRQEAARKKAAANPQDDAGPGPKQKRPRSYA